MNDLDSSNSIARSSVATEIGSGLEPQTVTSLTPSAPTPSEVNASFFSRIRPLSPSPFSSSWVMEPPTLIRSPFVLNFVNRDLLPAKNPIGSIPIQGVNQLIPAGTTEYDGKLIPRFLIIEGEEIGNRSFYNALSHLDQNYCDGVPRNLKWAHLVLGPDGSVEAIAETATRAEIMEFDAIPQEIAEADTIKIKNDTLPPDEPSRPQSSQDRRALRIRPSSIRPVSESSFRVGGLVGGTGLLIALDVLEYEGVLSPQGRKAVNLGFLGTLTYLIPSTPGHVVLISAPFIAGRELTSIAANSSGIKRIEQNSLGNKILGTLGGVGTTSAVIRLTGGVSVWHSAATSLQNQIGGALYTLETTILDNARPIAQTSLNIAKNYWNQAATFASTGAAWAAAAWNIARPILGEAAITAAEQTGPELAESVGIALLDGPEPGPADVAGAINAAIALGAGFLILGAGIQMAYQNIPSFAESPTENQSGKN